MKSAPRAFGLVTFLIAASAIGSAHAASPFDGTYSGTYVNTTPGGGGCSEGGTTSRQVVDGVFTSRWLTSELRATVSADGTIDGGGNVGGGGRGGGLVSIRGKIAGNVMSYDASSQRCQFHFEGRRR